MLLVKRGVLRMLKRPFALTGGLGMSLFFLLVYNARIGGVAFLPEFGGGWYLAFLPEFGGGWYLAFLLPMSLVSLAMGSAAGGGQSLHGDMAYSYFRRLYLSPVRRWTFVVAPITADAVATGIGALGVILAGMLFGVPLHFGIASVAGLLLLSLLWGITLSALSGTRRILV